LGGEEKGEKKEGGKRKGKIGSRLSESRGSGVFRESSGASSPPQASI
jgi:hypothetical protein